MKRGPCLREMDRSNVDVMKTFMNSSGNGRVMPGCGLERGSLTLEVKPEQPRRMRHLPVGYLDLHIKHSNSGHSQENKHTLDVP